MIIPDFGGGSSIRPNLEELIDRAKTRRSTYLKENTRSLLSSAGLVTGLVCFVLVVIIGAGPARQRMVDATASMERVADNLANAKAIPPDTAREIVRLLRKPGYDCNDLACDAVLERRNREVRRKLSGIVAKLAHLQAVNITAHRVPSIPEVLRVDMKVSSVQPKR